MIANSGDASQRGPVWGSQYGNFFLSGASGLHHVVIRHCYA